MQSVISSIGQKSSFAIWLCGKATNGAFSQALSSKKKKREREKTPNKKHFFLHFTQLQDGEKSRRAATPTATGRSIDSSSCFIFSLRTGGNTHCEPPPPSLPLSLHPLNLHPPSCHPHGNSALRTNNPSAIFPLRLLLHLPLRLLQHHHLPCILTLLFYFCSSPSTVSPSGRINSPTCYEGEEEDVWNVIKDDKAFCEKIRRVWISGWREATETWEGV